MDLDVGEDDGLFGGREQGRGFLDGFAEGVGVAGGKSLGGPVGDDRLGQDEVTGDFEIDRSLVAKGGGQDAALT